MRLRLLASLLLLLPIAARAQFQGCRQISPGVDVDTACIILSSSNVLDPSGNKLAAGQFILTVTDTSGTPIAYTPLGGSSTSQPFRGQIINGQVQNIAGFPFTIVNTQNASPTGLVFHYQLKSSDGTQVYQDYPLWNLNSSTGGNSLDSFNAQPGMTYSGMGSPRSACSPTSKYNQSDAAGGAKPWICSNLWRTDKSNQWTQNPSSNPQCPMGQAAVSPRVGNQYCILPENAYALPNEGFVNPDTVNPGPMMIDPLAQGGAQLPHHLNIIGGDGLGGALWMPEKGLAKVSADEAFVAWDEDGGMGRMDCRNAKYGSGGCLGPNPQQAMQDLSDDMTCWMAAHPNMHASTLLPAGVILVGTDAHPTLTFPSGSFIRGTGGEGGAGRLTGTVFQGHYNNHATWAVEGNHTVTSSVGNCPGTPVTNTNLGGSYERFSYTGCAVGGCVNVPGDTGNYPLGGPGNVGGKIVDAAYWADQLVAEFVGSDGTIFDGLDFRIGQAFAYSHDFYFYFGMDQAGQNYQFADGEIHAGINLSGGDAIYRGPYETYGATMDLGWEYGHICGVAWGGGISQLGPVFTQLEEIDECRLGTGPGYQAGGRLDASKGVSLLANGGGDTFDGTRAISPCNYDGANKYVIKTVTTATPGSGQTPGTYILTASSGSGAIGVTVQPGGTVTTDPVMRIHGRGYTSTPPTFTLAAGGTPATFTVTMETAWQVPAFMANGGQHIQENKCDPFVQVQSNFGIDTFIAPKVQNFDGIFGPSHATGDAYATNPATWIAPSGTGALSNNTGSTWRWDTATGGQPGAAQRIINPDVSLKYDDTQVNGSVLDLNLLGGTFEVVNTVPTTITSIINGWMQQDMFVIGDGFTTLPAYTGYGQGGGGGGVVGCTPGQNLLLLKNRLYHFKVENNFASFAVPTILGEVGCDANSNYQWLGFNALSSPPLLVTRATNHVIGTIAVGAYPPLPQATLSMAGGTTAFQYCFVREVRVAGGVQTDSPACSNKPPVTATSGNNLFINGPIPLNWLEWKVVFESTTDASFTALLGTVYDVTSPDGTPQQPIANIQAPIQPSNLTGDAYHLGANNYNLNFTGTYNYDLTLTPPAVSAVFCNAGQSILNSPSAPTGFDYLCNSSNHWVKRAVNAWAPF